MIVVTGAAGFIGSCLAECLEEDILCCDPADSQMLTPTACLEYLKNNDVACVYHLGAISQTTVTDAAAVVKNNVLFSSQLLEACIKKNIPFVYASSASVYGTIEGPHREEQELAPVNYYAISKAAFDMIALQKIKDNPAARIVGLRYFNVYGHREHNKDDMASPVHKFIQQARLEGEIRIFEGSDGFKRDFVHIEDVVAMTKAAASLDASLSGIYNVGSGLPRSFREVAEIVAQHLNAKIVEIPFPAHLEGKYQCHTQSDNTKLSAAGYPRVRISLEDGIRKVLKRI